MRISVHLPPSGFTGYTANILRSVAPQRDGLPFYTMIARGLGNSVRRCHFGYPVCLNHQAAWHRCVGIKRAPSLGTGNRNGCGLPHVQSACAPFPRARKGTKLLYVDTASHLPFSSCQIRALLSAVYPHNVLRAHTDALSRAALHAYRHSGCLRSHPPVPPPGSHFPGPWYVQGDNGKFSRSSELK